MSPFVDRYSQIRCHFRLIRSLWLIWNPSPLLILLGETYQPNIWIKIACLTFFNSYRSYCKSSNSPAFTTRNMWGYAYLTNENFSCLFFTDKSHIKYISTYICSLWSILSFYDRQSIGKIQHNKCPTLTLYSNYRIYMPHASMRVATFTSKRPGVHLNFENRTNNRHRIRKFGQKHILCFFF